MYRPDGWDSKKMHLDMLRANVDAMDGEAFIEAGADAMLEALVEDGVFTYGNHTPDIDLNDAPKESGYWVFIPDKEKK